MVEYPSWFFETDRRRIDAVLTEYNAPIVRNVRGDVVIIRGEYASEAVAVQAVLAVFQVIVHILLEHAEHQSAHTLRWEAHRLLYGVIAWAETPRPITRSTLDDFIKMVQAALTTCPWWVTFLATLERPVVTTKAPKSRTRDVARLKAERERVVQPLLNELEWTPTRWALECKLDPSVTLDYLAGTSTPRQTSKNKMTFILFKALKRDPLRLPD